MVDVLAGKQEESGVKLLWGTANCFTNPRYGAGAATNPDPEVFSWAATQVVTAMEATHKLGGENYVHGGISLQELTPRLFSFNNPYGACDNCDGLGALSKSTRPCYSRRKFKYNKRCYFSDRLGKCKQKRFDGLYVFYCPCRLLQI